MKSGNTCSLYFSQRAFLEFYNRVTITLYLECKKLLAASVLGARRPFTSVGNKKEFNSFVLKRSFHVTSPSPTCPIVKGEQREDSVSSRTYREI